MPGRFEVYEDRAGKHRLRLLSRSGRLVAVGEAHETRAEAIDKCRQVQEAAAGAEIVDLAATDSDTRMPESANSVHTECAPLSIGAGEGNEDVWIPPRGDCLQYRYDKPCSHCGSPNFHVRTRRCATCGRRPTTTNGTP